MKERRRFLISVLADVDLEHCLKLTQLLTRQGNRVHELNEKHSNSALSKKLSECAMKSDVALYYHIVILSRTWQIQSIKKGA